MRPLRLVHRHLPDLLLLGDELDCPRGRIYLIKEMLETGGRRPPTGQAHRSLPVLPGLHDDLPLGRQLHAPGRPCPPPIEETYRRPLARALAAPLLAPSSLSRAFRAGALRAASAGRSPAARRAGLAPARAHAAAGAGAAGAALGRRPQVFREGERRGRVALLPAASSRCCPDQRGHHPPLDPPRHRGGGGRGERLLRRARPPPRQGGARRSAARANIDAWTAEIDGEGLDAILVTASGCGTTVKDYGFMLRTEPAYADKAARVPALPGHQRISRPRFASRQGAPAASRWRIIRRARCSMVRKLDAPKELLSKCGFVVKDVPEGHLCCGSAGTYNILQPELAGRLRERKIANIEKVRPDVIAAGNTGCMMQIAAGTAIPMVHTVELIDWATGGPVPKALADRRIAAAANEIAVAK